MSGLGFNMVAGAVLATALGIVGLRELSSIVYETEPAEKAGYAIEVVEETAGAPVAEVPPDWGTVLPVADVAAGKTVAGKCLSCHTLEAGQPNGIGPNQYGVVGRKPGVHPGFAYSDAMVAFGNMHPAWDYVTLDTFIANPQKTVPGTKMTFVGVKNQKDRVNLIAYLRSLSASPAAIPAPNPAAAAAATPAAGASPAGAPVAAPPGTPPGNPSGGPAGQGSPNAAPVPTAGSAGGSQVSSSPGNGKD